MKIEIKIPNINTPIIVRIAHKGNESSLSSDCLCNVNVIAASSSRLYTPTAKTYD